VIFGNCQSFGLAHFLRKAKFPYDIKVFENYKLILKEQTPEALRESAAQCDLFIAQPTREMAHGELSAEYYIEKVIPKTAQVITFPYCVNNGFFPLIGHGDGFMGTAEMSADYWKLSKDCLLAMYDTGLIDFALWPRFLACAAEQARREQQCDIRLSTWIINNRHLPLFLNFNHPSSLLFAELAREVISFVNDAEAPEIHVHGLNEANLPCDLPFSSYVIEEFNWQIQANPFAHAHYRKLLGMAWDKGNPLSRSTT